MKNYFKLLILFILLVSINFMFLIPIDLFVTIKYLGVLAILIISSKWKYIVKNKSIFKINILFFVGLLLTEIIYSKIKYNQDFRDIISQAMPYFIVLLYYPLTYKINNDKIEYIKRCIIKISLILSIIITIQYYLFNIFRIQFLKLNLGAMMRFGEVRITAGSIFISIGVILSLGIMLNNYKKSNKEKIVYILTIIIGIYNVVFIGKTRMVSLVLGIAILSMILVCGEFKFSRIRNFYIIIMLFLVVINLPIVKSYLNVSSTDMFSTVARVEAINYYINETLEEPILGVGILSDNEKYYDSIIKLHGYKGEYYRDDVGIIGFFNCFGIIGVIWYIIIIFKCLRISCKNLICDKKKVELLGVTTFLIASSGTIIIMDAQRIVYLPIILSLISYKEEKNI